MMFLNFYKVETLTAIDRQLRYGKIKTLKCKRVNDTSIPRMSVCLSLFLYLSWVSLSPLLSGLGLRTVFGENGKNRQEGRK